PIWRARWPSRSARDAWLACPRGWRCPCGRRDTGGSPGTGTNAGPCPSNARPASPWPPSRAAAYLSSGTYPGTRPGAPFGGSRQVTHEQVHRARLVRVAELHPTVALIPAREHQHLLRDQGGERGTDARPVHVAGQVPAHTRRVNLPVMRVSSGLDRRVDVGPVVLSAGQRV